jgi:hypothetical protein
MKIHGGRPIIGWGTALFAAGALTPLPWEIGVLIALIATFLLVWSYAPHYVAQAAHRVPPEWQLDRKLDLVAQALDGPASQHEERMGRLANLTKAGTEIMERKVTVPDLYEAWKRDLDSWVSRTSSLLEQEFGNAAREMFMDLEPAPARSIRGAVNPEHGREMWQLMNRLRRLTVITKRYGA